MKKPINNIYDNAITFSNIRHCWNIVRRTCKNKNGVLRFALNENANIYNICTILKNRKYIPYHFTLFVIFEPKARLVMSQTVNDKVVNHFVANYYLLPYLENKLCSCNVATRKNMGSKYAHKKIIDYLNTLILKNNKDTNLYCLKLDISKYFYNIDHKILFKMLEKDISDKDVLNLIKVVISETNKPYTNYYVDLFTKKYNIEIPHYKEDIGLSIGAMTSQFLAIYYLNGLDHYIKEKLHCKYYIRYMDDLVILDSNKKRLLEVWKIIEEYVKCLNLKLNSKSNIYNMKNGFSFLGYNFKVKNGHLKVNYRKATYKRIKKKLKILNKYNKIKYYRSYASYYGYFKNIRHMERSFKMSSKDKYAIYKEKYPKHIILLKEGAFYKTFFDDAVILWDLFGYNWKNDSTGFGTMAYDKVVIKLNSLELSYVVVNEKEIVIDNNSDAYEAYYKVAKLKFDNFIKREKLHKLIDEILNNGIKNFDAVYDFLQEYADNLE